MSSVLATQDEFKDPIGKWQKSTTVWKEGTWKVLSFHKVVEQAYDKWKRGGPAKVNIESTRINFDKMKCDYDDIRRIRTLVKEDAPDDIEDARLEMDAFLSKSLKFYPTGEFFYDEDTRDALEKNLGALSVERIWWERTLHVMHWTPLEDFMIDDLETDRVYVNPSGHMRVLTYIYQAGPEEKTLTLKRCSSSPRFRFCVDRSHAMVLVDAQLGGNVHVYHIRRRTFIEVEKMSDEMRRTWQVAIKSISICAAFCGLMVSVHTFWHYRKLKVLVDRVRRYSDLTNRTSGPILFVDAVTKRDLSGAARGVVKTNK